MKIHSITIHNFRSVLDATVCLGDYGLLVGSNNAGKSNIIDAIRAFYDQIKFDQSRDFPKLATKDAESWVEVDFALSGDEAKTISPEYLEAGNRFRIRRSFAPAAKATIGLVGYKNGEMAPTAFYGYKNVGTGKLGEVVYIPASGEIDDHTKLTGPSVLRDLVTSILKPVIKSSSAFSALTGQVAEFGAKIRSEQTNDSRSIIGLEQAINADLGHWDASFELSIEAPTDDDIIKSMMKPIITDVPLGASLETDRFGHGFQRQLIFTLIKTAAGYAAPVSQPKTGAFMPELNLLLFEEPEAFLHPPQQDLLDTGLRTMGSQPTRQVLVATHSPQFVSYNTDDLADLMKVCRVGGATVVRQLSRQRIEDIFTDDLAVKAVEDASPDPNDKNVAELELESVRHFLWLNPERSSVFFADFVLIVEGLSEQVLINYLIKEGEIKPPRGSYFVVECFGKYNVHRFMTLLGELGIRHAVLHDGDASKTGKQKKVQDALNALIAKSKNSETVGIGTIPDTLESFLGVVCDSRDRWKAHRLLMVARAQTMESKRRQAFIALVQGLFDAA